MLGGKFNLGDLMKGAKKIQEMMEKNQAELAKIEVVGEAGAGLVKVTMSAQYLVKELLLADELLIELKEVIQDLITAAINNATHKINQLIQEKMTNFSQLLNLQEDQK